MAIHQDGDKDDDGSCGGGGHIGMMKIIGWIDDENDDHKDDDQIWHIQYIFRNGLPTFRVFII